MPCISSSFRTVIAAGTDTDSLPTGAAVTVNPTTLYADGINTATVMITNINLSGVLVPNGTKVAISVAPAYRVSSAGGSIPGGLPAADPRFRIFETLGGAITLTYQSPELLELQPGQSASAYIQIAQLDALDNPMRLISTGTITLVRGRTAKVTTNPVSLLAGNDSYAEVNIIIKDYTGNPVTPGTEVGITAEPVYNPDSLGGTINGGIIGSDARFKVFSTISGGIVKTTYRPPVLAEGQSGAAYIQVVSIDGEGQVSGLLGTATINLSTTIGYTAPQPEILTVSPVKGSMNMPLNTIITARFSQALDPATVNSTNFSVKRGSIAIIAGTLTLSPDGKAVSFTPSALLVPNSSFSIYIGTGIKSMEGNPLLSYRYSSFSTEVAEDTTPPSVIAINPPDTVAGVGINTAITVQFSEQMNASSINAMTFKVTKSGVSIPGRIEISSGNSIATFIPDDLLEPETEYTAAISSTVTDTAGNAMLSDFTSRFTTATGVDNFQPMLVSVSPANWSKNVPADITVTVTFSEKMDPVTINSSTFQLTWSGYYYYDVSIIKGTITLGSGNTTATFTPAYPLIAGTEYYLNVKTSVRDISGNPLVSSFSSSFSVFRTPNPDIQPTGATVTFNPDSIFANGKNSTSVIVSNINNFGTPVPNGTIIAVTADPVFVQYTVGGTITGGSTGSSPDTRFTLFETYGAKVEFSYTPPDLTGMRPGVTAAGVIQIASVDGDNWPVRLAAQEPATLFYINSATVVAEPDSFVIGQQGTSIITVTVKDCYRDLVPDGTKVGLTVVPVFVSSSTMGGTIQGGTTSIADPRIQIFTTTGGQFTATYISPSEIPAPGDETIQAVTVDTDGHVTGLIATETISFRE